jgi:15-cis-phytoene synthase
MADSNKKLLKHNKKSNFFYSFLFLPGEKRTAINIVYAFCQYSDNIVDSGHSKEDKRKELKEWRDEFSKSKSNNSRFALQNEVANTINRFNIPIEYFEQLLDGMEMDVEDRKYNTFEDLYEYCYRVASTVGLISAKIFGYKNPLSREYAINLGIALQLTNILRDIHEDLEIGRIYIPQNELHQFHVTEENLRNHDLNTNFLQMMQFQYNRILDYYKKADQLLKREDKRNFIAARIMRNIYFEILIKIKKNNFDIFKNKIRLSKFKKLLVLFTTIINKK